MPRKYTLTPSFFEQYGFLVILGLLIAGAAIFPVAFRMYYWKYYSDYTGETETQVIEVLGQPYADSRVPFTGLISISSGEDAPEYRTGEPFELVWSYYFGGRLSVSFEDGVAVSQRRFSK